MDELKKIPPVSRFLILGSLGLTIPVILKILDVSPFVLYWPFIRYRYQFWRLFTSFFFAGNGIQLIFDILALFRSSTALEEGEPFYRSSSAYAWTLIQTNALIVLLNIPLNSAVLFRPMLYAITTFWSRAYRSNSVNLFGVVNVPAPLLPYAYLVLDVLMGGPHTAIQSGTGILAAYAIHYIRDEIPRPPPGSRLSSQGSIFKRVVGVVQKFVCEPPQVLQRLLPDSTDPVSGASATPTSSSGATTGGGRAMRSTPFGTAFAPRGRAFGSAPTAAPSGGSTASRQPPTGSSSSASTGGWFGNLFSSGSGGGSSTSTSAARRNDPEAARREAMLEAIERRNRAARNDSIAGRAQQAAAGSNVLQQDSTKTSHTSALASSSPLTSNLAVRRTAASTSAGTGSGQGAHGNVHSLQFGSAVDKKEAGGAADEPELDASGSGGRVAEQRRATAEGKDKGKEGEDGKVGTASPASQAWGGGGGRRLDD
ncbi:unnamed protein product [Tilletia controversa]|uniref:Derlin n=1 Tax=Tilletia controversa TaxID=13291 RepID=A0A8X7SUG6_9BASI|nr:hypothetical protein CF328_g6128 [Tilletia controversa]KAE8242317.1 hypothetical protein A4X06_0g7019 [Tilletia controversa]CAD6901241.1 unnamed protein product [Tilletia controversa]CAD6939324.1 unnamed protein product [Tilletia controversa]CAD6943012.1 unnamed protein product [Tilletia controversa]